MSHISKRFGTLKETVKICTIIYKDDFRLKWCALKQSYQILNWNQYINIITIVSGRGLWKQPVFIKNIRLDLRGEQ